MIKKETIDAIFEAARIEEVVGEFVNLKKSGSGYKGLSPFTNEKTPSFHVSPAKGIYKCFSSGRGGNAVSFLMELEKFSYPEALKYLAKKYNIEIVEEEQTQEAKEKQDERESLYAVTKFASEYFKQMLWENEEGRNIGLSYFKERGYSEETIQKFDLGYCGTSWDDFTQKALSEKYQKEILLKSGLTKEGKGGKLFDFFHGRVIFPIHSTVGKVIAFGARILDSSSKQAKYFNSPENDLYHKSKVLYGLNQAKKAILLQDECLLVEGYTDVVSLHQMGIENVVASAGTSLTADQISLIKRFTPNITVLYDGDAAGIKASFRGIDLLLAQGINVRCVLFPEGEDPDSYSKRHGEHATKEFLDANKKDFIRFKTEVLLEGIGDDPIAKSKLLKDIVQSIALIPDAITRQVFLKQCSRSLDMSENALLSELNKALVKKNAPSNLGPQNFDEPIPDFREKAETGHAFHLLHQERELLRVVLMFGNENAPFSFTNIEGEKVESYVNIGEFVLNTLEKEGMRMETPNFQKALDILNEFYEEHKTFDSKPLVQYPDLEIQQVIVDILSSPHKLSNWERYFIFPKGEEEKLEDLVKTPLFSYMQKVLELRIMKLQEQLKTIVDDAEINDNLAEQIQLKEISKMLALNLNKRVVLR